MSAQSAPSKSRVDKAGRNICKWLARLDQDTELTISNADTQIVVPDSIVEDFRVANEWRMTHAAPLSGVNGSLRSFSSTTGIETQIAQRHKRLRRILFKLARAGSTMRLSAMQDIGGCRVIFRSLDELTQYRAHLESSWGDKIIRVDDYIASPKDTGYRAVHVVTRRQGRAIEVQLRVDWMHDWADSVERFGRQRGVELKAGLGDKTILQYLRVIADINAVAVDGMPPPESMLAELHQLSLQLEERSS